MQTTEGLKSCETHFRFGENWAHFAEKIDESRIRAAQIDLNQLVTKEFIADKSVLDIGSGSGLHSLAFLLNGAKEVLAIDIDPESFVTTQKTLRQFAPDPSKWSTERKSIFDFGSLPKKFDIVYSWGVLHHTGAMWEAITCSSKCVKNQGLLALALYRETWFCGIWRVEKRIYRKLPKKLQELFIKAYAFFFSIFLAVHKRQSLQNYIKNYSTRGMNFYHDVHDWLGGYPYESVKPAALKTFMKGLGFECIRSKIQSSLVSRIGLFGSGCDEYVFKKT